MVIDRTMVFDCMLRSSVSKGDDRETVDSGTDSFSCCTPGELRGAEKGTGGQR